MDSMGDRLKRYEAAYDQTIISRVPVIIRLDGKGFSRWTKSVSAVKPFDNELSNNMANAMVKTAEKIEGCLFGFTQSDEITFVLRNDQSLESSPWFSNRIQKICSITSSIFTAEFNRNWGDRIPPDTYFPLAYFDARVFAVPTLQESINTLIWRQQDSVKNSISCSTYYECAKKIGKGTARKQMEGLNGKQQQEMLFQTTGLNWSDYPTKFKRGIGCYKKIVVYPVSEINGSYTRSEWVIDNELPIFASNQEWLRTILGPEG